MRCARHSPDGAGPGTDMDGAETWGLTARPVSVRTSWPLSTPSSARAAAQAVAVVDGKIAENLHIVTARALIARAGAIAAMAAQ